jgi:hypothetical protein
LASAEDVNQVGSATVRRGSAREPSPSPNRLTSHDRGSGKIRILLDFTGEFDGLEAGAVGKDLKMGVGEWSAWERMAQSATAERLTWPAASGCVVP